MFSLENITRKNIQEMTAYSSARDEFGGTADVWLDANENPNNTALNRYPDPLQNSLKKEIAKLKKVNVDQIFIGNGSDEAIDLLFRAFCEPGYSAAILFSPTYGMYEVSAAINNVGVIEIPLSTGFEIPSLTELRYDLSTPGLLFICSPNNPTGNSTAQNRIIEIAQNYAGIVVVDEAYIDFSENESALSLINEVPNLVVLQTFSKAYGLAGARLGMAFANADIISILNKIKPPYNVNTLSAEAAVQVLKEPKKINDQIAEIVSERNMLTESLRKLKNVSAVFPSDANFLLVQFTEAKTVFNALIDAGIVVRDRSGQIENCLRITVGTKAENRNLLSVLKAIEK